ncbi:GNAT family N-acetyltransferase [Eupransor demetentiae]|uniref:Ribosomal protein S18 acetylase RimI and related acetyltransferases (RimI) n=1 Tax=Eupransor demetentiae TaxID=3109584 RepID=A0ABP0ET74_9LACO|nr:Ribosomal protein S18 acetylase RimI and related acetyltransferases (RimI) [Lactobacillaceae bacterium LMG 33000]
MHEATAQDLEQIEAIMTAAFADNPLPRQVAEHQIDSPRSHFLLSEHGLIAFTEILDEIEIDYLAVLPVAQGKGEGRALLEAVFQRPGIYRFLLEVAADNEPALKLYQKVGFREYRRRAHYYRNGQDAIMMEKEND